MTLSRSAFRSRRVWWLLCVLALLAVRVPSIVEPMGGDQGFYAYEGQRVIAGGVPYRDAWDQKPPGIMAVYAILWRVWPHESVVPAADLMAAAVVAAVLIVLGRRFERDTAGYGAAIIFLLFGDPWLSRLSGVFVRAQCETFIVGCVAIAIALVARTARSRPSLILAGIALGAACWLKYNAVAYVLPVTAALIVWPRAGRRGVRAVAMELAWIAAGMGGLTAIVLAYFAAHGALGDLTLATVAYNLRYSGETYSGPLAAVTYLIRLPYERALVEMIWFLGLVGSGLVALRLRDRPAGCVILAWVAAAILSIAVNSHRDLPQYFVQAHPALALAAATGLATLGRRRFWLTTAVAVVLVAGFWRVGDEPTRGPRLAGLGGLVENLRFDVDYARGVLDRTTYLDRFQGRKYDAPEFETLADFVERTTTPADTIFVFGYGGGSVSALSGRASASRFFWSRPVVIEFESWRPGYGTAGLVADLDRQRPAVVALQKKDWRPADPDSAEFFDATPALHNWLVAGYVLDHDTRLFSVWRRRS